MNLEDVLDPECGLQQDEWSLTRPTFGKDNQLTVIGWSGKVAKTKLYIVECAVCKEDLELFGQAVFSASKSNLTKGATPCGCGGNVRWSDGQYKLRVERKLYSTPYSFVKFENTPVRKGTHVVIECPDHGQWKSTSVNSFLTQGGSCPSCKYEKIANDLRLDDDSVIGEFIRTGKFSESTQFRRCFDTDRKGSFWYVDCPVCRQTVISNQSDLKSGKVPCSCTRMAQRYAYISLIYDNSTPVGVKFGIAVDPAERCYRQNLTSSLHIKLWRSFLFATKQECVDAERACKDSFERPVIAKEDFPDGYTETTYLHNLDKIIEIYKNFGGRLTFKSEE